MADVRQSHRHDELIVAAKQRRGAEQEEQQAVARVEPGDDGAVFLGRCVVRGDRQAGERGCGQPEMEPVIGAEPPE